MDDLRYDRIRIRDWTLMCILGVYEQERQTPRPVCVNLTIWTEAAERGDDLARAIDYDRLQQDIGTRVEASCFRLVESLAEMIAEAVLEDRRVALVTACVGKPGALRGVRTVEVEVTRTRKDGRTA